MSEIAIKVENLSKRYRIGLQEEMHDTMAGALIDFVKQPLHNLRRLRHLTRFSENGHQPDVVWALKDVSFEVKRGEVVGIIGRNGAGKSTLLKILSRITHPTSGRVELNGRVSSLLEVGTGFHPELTGRENIYLNGTILGMRKAEIDRKFDEIIDFSGVEKFIDTPVKRYSSGMRVRLAFSVAAHLEPEILLVDEVLAVGDVEFQKKCLGKMGDVAESGRTVIFVSHQMVSVERLCTRCILLENGALVKSGEVARTIEYYLAKILEPAVYDDSLLAVMNRSGSGMIRFVSFHVENSNGCIVHTVRSGMDLAFVFGYQCSANERPENVDVGFSIHDPISQKRLSGLYSSYVDDSFKTVPETGYFKCEIERFPFSAGRYLIQARITANGLEADWPRDGIGFIEVESGDFYESGREGFGRGTPFLFTGKWMVEGKDEAERILETD